MGFFSCVYVGCSVCTRIGQTLCVCFACVYVCSSVCTRPGHRFDTKYDIVTIGKYAAYNKL